MSERIFYHFFFLLYDTIVVWNSCVKKTSTTLKTPKKMTEKIFLSVIGLSVPFKKFLLDKKYFSSILSNWNFYQKAHR